MSEREHLEQVQKQVGKTPLPLIGPDFPHLVDHVWQYFLELHKRRQTGANGPCPLSYTEIGSWQAITGNSISVWEVDLLTKLDTLYMRVINDRPS